MIKKIAAIQIGEYSPNYEEKEVDIYYYPESITEYELIDELKYLKEFYDSLLIPKKLPVHIRLERIALWINGI